MEPQPLLPVLVIRLSTGAEFRGVVGAALYGYEICLPTVPEGEADVDYTIQVRVEGWPPVLIPATSLGPGGAGGTWLRLRPFDDRHRDQLEQLAAAESGRPPPLSQRFVAPPSVRAPPVAPDDDFADGVPPLPSEFPVRPSTRPSRQAGGPPAPAPGALTTEHARIASGVVPPAPRIPTGVPEVASSPAAAAPGSPTSSGVVPAGETPLSEPPVSEAPRSLIPAHGMGASLIGRHLSGGKYLIESLLGEGAAGAVYKARHTSLEKTIAIKVMHPHFRADPTFAQRFQAEALAASKLDHPNVLRVMDFGEEPDGLLYIAMEFLKGKDLRGLMEQEPVPRARRLDILCQMLAALAAAGDMGIVHRDVKPENTAVVPVSGDDGGIVDRVKVLDFGLATIDPSADPTGTLAQAKVQFIAGTPHYMSPEQCRGEDLDPRSDVYAAGIMLFELVTGRLPFDADEQQEILQKHIYEDPPRMRAIDRSIPAALEAMVQKAIAKDRNQRYQSARDFRAALLEYIRSAKEGQADTLGVTPLESPEAGFGEFFTSLTAAVASTTYYEKGHPEFGRALNRLTASLRAPFKDRGEITLSLRDAKDAQLSVQTGAGEILELRRALGAGLADAYAPRLVEVFHRRQVVSLSLREGIRTDELAEVVDLLSGPEISASELRDRFLRSGLEHVSILFAEELLGNTRRLPWQVDLCVSRLARDLRAIPLLRDIDASRMRTIREQLVGDVVRNITKPADMHVLLQNTDLVDDKIRALPELAGTEPLALLVASLHPRMVMRVTEAVADQLEQGGDFTVGVHPKELLRVLCARLAAFSTEEADAALRKLGQRSLLTFGDVPAELREWLDTERAADALLRDPGVVLARLARMDLQAAEAAYTRLGGALRALARRGEAAAVAATLAPLAQASAGHRPGRGSHAALAARAAACTDDPEFVDAFARLLLSGPAAQRDGARAVLGLCGAPGVESLVALRKQSVFEIAARPRFVGALRELEAAAPVVERELTALTADVSSADAFLLEDLLRALGRAASPAAVEGARRAAQHTDAGVRRQALGALTTLAGLAAKPALLKALDDPQDGVRITALRGLRDIQSIDPPVLTQVDRLLNGDPPASDEVREAAAAAVAGAVPAAREVAFEVLSRALAPRSASVLKLLMSTSPQAGESPRLLATVARVLIGLDAERGRAVVQARIGKSKGEVKHALEDALVARPGAAG